MLKGTNLVHCATLKRPYGRFRGGPPAGWAGVLRTSSTPLYTPRRTLMFQISVHLPFSSIKGIAFVSRIPVWTNVCTKSSAPSPMLHQVIGSTHDLNPDFRFHVAFCQVKGQICSVLRNFKGTSEGREDRRRDGQTARNDMHNHYRLPSITSGCPSLAVGSVGQKSGRVSLGSPASLIGQRERRHGDGPGRDVTGSHAQIPARLL
jgi:hypothetical protein